MSNLKRDIEGVLDILLRDILRSRGSSPLKGLSIRETATTQIINLIESVADDMEYQETEDMSLKSWTPEDYKAFGRNELRADIKSKLIGEGK